MIKKTEILIDLIIQIGKQFNSLLEKLNCYMDYHKKKQRVIFKGSKKEYTYFISSLKETGLVEGSEKAIFELFLIEDYSYNNHRSLKWKLQNDIDYRVPENIDEIVGNTIYIGLIENKEEIKNYSKSVQDNINMIGNFEQMKNKYKEKD